MKKVGLIINPVAGMGGRVGLKGTDGVNILRKAIKLGAMKEAPRKALRGIERLLPIKDDIIILTCSGDMGEDQCKGLGFNVRVILESSGNTTSRETMIGASIMEEKKVELLIFVGGDGTARDIYKGVGNRIVTLGIPAGVKIHSPVYANTPEKAGDLALLYLKGENFVVKEEEVIDIDEEAFRKNEVRTRLFGYLKVPYKKEYLQNKKAPTPLKEEENQKAIALDIIDNMIDGVYYIIGPGTTTRAIMEGLNLPYTLLGVDIIKDKKLIKSDCSEKDILQIVSNSKSKLIITPTGGQGYLLGRGNQQISDKVIKKIEKENIYIISSNRKIVELGGKPLLIYTGDKDIDLMLEGYYRVKVGYGIDIMYRVSKG
ncbi:ATP-NAD kinase family protein [Tissierella sp. MSJ-40]|uniref:ATP-NAD kinase family protein n=1 Tax=Tissierella simiarum TaxID=2841534 RepID=A0ABS6EAM8_9FIRM|nr:ATP-NAD kinase family protein [Tissierella simiarum]MBU5439254.1 ATP-NAD kinase family protein [Tissierella simiarum]